MKMMLEFDYKKATQAINYLIKRDGGKIDKLKLIKLIYLADRYHIRKYGRPIMNDAYWAMRLGPVGSAVKEIAEFSTFLDETEKNYANQYLAKGGVSNTVVSIAEIDTKIFSESEIEALDFAYTNFGTQTASSLVDVTHEYPEWEKYKEILESGESTREPMSYLDFFGNPENITEDKFALEADVLSSAKELFEEDYKISEYWK